MAEEQPSLHIDTDWKKQAQEEKRKLAEQEKAKTEHAKPTTAAPPSPFAGGSPEAASRGRAAGGRGGAGSFTRNCRFFASYAVLVQSIVTQALFYLGDLAPRGSEPQINLDMAKHQVDLLGVLEEKTKGNLSDEEKHFLGRGVV